MQAAYYLYSVSAEWALANGESVLIEATVQMPAESPGMLTRWQSFLVELLGQLPRPATPDAAAKAVCLEMTKLGPPVAYARVMLNSVRYVTYVRATE